ncbi:hypothetical protein O9993_13760 [Vibrio lentus]|nr:hypothetical protein [Vibrio lentus]
MVITIIAKVIYIEKVPCVQSHFICWPARAMQMAAVAWVGFPRFWRSGSDVPLPAYRFRPRSAAMTKLLVSHT